MFSLRITFSRWHLCLFTTQPFASLHLSHSLTLGTFGFDISISMLFEHRLPSGCKYCVLLIQLHQFSLQSMDSATPTYYDVLNCVPSDSVETIKRCYQSLMLRHHPDKQRQQTHPTATNELQCVQRIDEAWKVLRDPVKRKFYDAEIQQRRFDERPIVHETLTPDQFTFDSDHQSNVRPCRCGGQFVLPDEFPAMAHHDDDEIFIECDECSLVVQLIVRTKR